MWEVVSLHKYTATLFLYLWNTCGRLEDAFNVEKKALMSALNEDTLFNVPRGKTNVDHCVFFDARVKKYLLTYVQSI